MNYVGLDISLSSTGLYILKEDGTELYFNYRNKDKLTKWHKTLSFINYHSYKTIKSDVYSDSEILKSMTYTIAKEQIVKDILDNVEPSKTIISVEGYSYSSRNTSSLIDIVSLSALIRSELLTYNFYDFRVLAPMTLKVETAKITYEPIIKIINKGKKNERKEYTYKNKFGISGGKFTKHDMLDALIDHDNNTKIKQILLPHHKKLQLMKNIPSPIDDIVDAIFLVLTQLEKDRVSLNNS